MIAAEFSAENSRHFAIFRLQRKSPSDIFRNHSPNVVPKLMKNTNKHNLSRTIPEPIKRQIRQNAGFGCVICGLGIIEYEHIEPEFNNAKEHNPLKMTLLCPNCHRKVTSGIWSKSKVHDAMLKPKALSQGYSNEIFDIGNGFPIIHFAGSKFQNCPIPIVIHNYPLFTIEPKQDERGYFLLGGNFTDSNGKPTLKIYKNEWIAKSDSWDVEVVGKVMTIREKERDISLQLTAEPPDTIRITRINMRIQDSIIDGNEKEFKVSNLKSGSSYTFSKCIVDNCLVGINL